MTISERKAPDYGEPFSYKWLVSVGIPFVVNKHGIMLLKEDVAVVVRRANALAGCPDPDDFIRTLKVIIEMAGQTMENQMRAARQLRKSSPLSWLREESK